MIAPRLRRAMMARTLAASLLAAIAACSTAAPRSPRDAETYQVATFEPSSQGATLWAHGPAADRVDFEIVPTGGGETTWVRGLALGEASGFSGAVRAKGLVPATRYKHRAHFASGRVSRWYSFTTAPPPRDDAELFFAYSADIGPRTELYGIFEKVTALEPMFYVSLGDWPYADKPPPATTLDEFRAKHATARAHPAVSRFLEQTPMFATWDDHDVIGDWDAFQRSRAPRKIAAGMQAWTEWFATGTAHHYRSWRWGRHVELFLLDTRSRRSANLDPDGPEKTMLGVEQKNWLKYALRTSTATFKLVFTSVPLDFGGGNDHWNVFTHERNEILRAIGEIDVRGVVFLTADRHWFGVNHHACGVREFQVGPLAAGLKRLPPVHPVETVARRRVRNFGTVRVIPGPDPRLEFTAYDKRGEIIHRETFRPEDSRVAHPELIGTSVAIVTAPGEDPETEVEEDP